MASEKTGALRTPLYSQLEWFISLRWVAAAAVVLGSWIDYRFLHWYTHPMGGMALGGFVLAYNAALSWALAQEQETNKASNRLQMLAWLQLILDMACLSLLTLWTGTLHSPLRGFFVFHMVFASLLLSRWMAYGTAAAAIAML